MSFPFAEVICLVVACVHHLSFAGVDLFNCSLKQVTTAARLASWLNLLELAEVVCLLFAACTIFRCGNYG